MGESLWRKTAHLSEQCLGGRGCCRKGWLSADQETDRCHEWSCLATALVFQFGCIRRSAYLLWTTYDNQSNFTPLWASPCEKLKQWLKQKREKVVFYCVLLLHFLFVVSLTFSRICKASDVLVSWVLGLLDNRQRNLPLITTERIPFTYIR